MAITSFTWLLFLVAAVALYYVIPKKFRWLGLLAAGVFWYAVCSGWGIVCILFTALSVWGAGLLLQKTAVGGAAAVKAEGADAGGKGEAALRRKKRIILLLPLVINLFIFAAFRYEGVYEGLIAPVRLLLTGKQLGFAQIAAPVGLAFYTLQAIGYLLDIYRGRQQAERNPLRVMTFLMFFPQLARGPVNRYGELAPRLFEGHALQFDNLEKGIIMIGWGFMKKLLLADRLYLPVNAVFSDPGSRGGAMIFLASVLYALELYADLSGCMDIVRGAARMFGIEMPDDFRQPFAANTLSEYWQRWQITLVEWMKDYVSDPLRRLLAGRSGRHTGNSGGAGLAGVLLPALRGFAAFVLIGVWHGAAVNFLIYGLYHGVLAAAAILMKPYSSQWLQKARIDPESRSWRSFRKVRTFVAVTFGCCILRAADVVQVFRTIFARPSLQQLSQFMAVSGWSETDVVTVLLLLALTVTADRIAEKLGDPLEWLKKRSIVLRWIFYLLIIVSLTLLIPETPVTGGTFYASF